MPHDHDSLHAYHKWPANVRAHLIDPDGHNLSVTKIDRMTDPEVLIGHDALHPSGPTPEDRAAGMAAAVDTAIAGTLRKLAARSYDIPHADIGRNGDSVAIADIETVARWLLGWAVKIENGESV